MQLSANQSPLLQALLESGRHKENASEIAITGRCSASAEGDHIRNADGEHLSVLQSLLGAPVNSTHVSRIREEPSTHPEDHGLLRPQKKEFLDGAISENDGLSPQRQNAQLLDQTQLLAMPKHDPSDNSTTTRIKLHLAYVFYQLAKATATSDENFANKE
ncbi:hypothetical protein Aduo_005410 [Ancylostoma duodenale]